MKRTGIILATLMVVIGPLLADDGKGDFQMKGSRPNVVFFLGDDQSRFDHTTYGHPSVPTPITAAFAKEALVFEKAFTGQAICAPSRSMLYSGLYPVRNGCFMNHTAVRPGIETLPALLKKQGYKVILAGKSHVKPAKSFPWSESFAPVKKEGAARDWIPLEEIDRFLANPGPEPFCLIVASEFPHGPYQEETTYKPEDVVLPPFANTSEESLREVTHYYANIEQKEAEFAALLKLLDKHDQSEKSLVFYADDHGKDRGKYTSYDSGLKVAFMARWPGKVAAGRTDALVSFADFVPTMIELAGGSPKGFDGKSLLPVLTDQSKNHHDFVYGVTVNQGTLGRHVFPQRSIHDGRYHYIYNFNTIEKLAREEKAGKELDFFLKKGAEKYPDYREEMLFDTQADPHELSNIAALPEHAALKQKLKEQLFRWMKEQNDYLLESGSLPFLKANAQFGLDKKDQRNRIPASQQNSLRGKTIDPHKATEPKQTK